MGEAERGVHRRQRGELRLAAADHPRGRGDQKASGLGLYLCRTICRKLGHSITAESAPDEGTAIRIGLSQRQVRE